MYKRFIQASVLTAVVIGFISAVGLNMLKYDTRANIAVIILELSHNGSKVVK